MAEAALRRTPQVSAGNWLRTLPPAARWVLHGNAQARALAVPVWGVGFSATACRALRTADRATLWLGPEEYLLLDLAAQDQTDRSLATTAAIEAALHDIPHALVDVSHRQFALEVSGPHASTILSGACPSISTKAHFPPACAPAPFSPRPTSSSGGHAPTRSISRYGAPSRTTSADCCVR